MLVLLLLLLVVLRLLMLRGLAEHLRIWIGWLRSRAAGSVGVAGLLCLYHVLML